MTRSIFKTDRKASLESKIKRFSFNFHPAYRRSGGRVCFISSDWQEVHVKLGLNRRTRNIVGTVFGGSIFSSLDPIYMTQFIKILGAEYIVWDKSATINFIKPITKTVFARFLITDELLEEIKARVEARNKYTFEISVAFEDEKGSIYAECNRTIFVGDKSYMDDLMQKRAHSQS